MSDTVTHRGLRIEDAAAVAELFAAMERADPVDEAFDEQDFIEEFSGPRADLERGSVVIHDDDRLIAAGWLLRKTSPTELEFNLEGGVHPDHVGRGLGRRVLQELADRAARIRDVDAPGLPGVLKVAVDELRPRSVALITAAGYQTWRYFLRMRCDLPSSAPPVVQPPVVQPPVVLPPGVEIRPYQPADDESVRLVSNESWVDHWGSVPMDQVNWRAQFADSPSFRPDHSRVALLDGTIVGFVLVAEFDADTAARGYRTGYVARVGTVQRARGRSIASNLLADSLQSLAAAGYRCAELDVDAESPTGAGPLYERAGFRTIGRMHIFGRRF